MTPGRLVAAALCAAAFVLAGVAVDVASIDLARLFVFGAALGGAVAVDVAERRIPNRLVLPASAVCAALSIAGGVRATDVAAGAALVALLFTFTLWRPDSFGMGDVKLALLVVLGLNGNAAQALLLGLAIAAVLGVLIVIREGFAARRRALPLAPFIAAGALVALIA
jgi:leader peptidase (prepilin peptidase) / N-methyltransferase